MLTKAFTDGILQADGTLKKLSEAEYIEAISTRLGILKEEIKDTNDIGKELGFDRKQIVFEKYD